MTTVKTAPDLVLRVIHENDDLWERDLFVIR